MLQAINNFTITGNLTKDPEARKTANGKTYAVVTVAVNEAINNAIKAAEEEMGAITGGLNLPGMF